MKKCRTCDIQRPPRTFHCGECEACIEVHDHHCPWVGNCIGKRNRPYFICFLNLVTAHALITVIINVVFLLQRNQEDSEVEEESALDKIRPIISVSALCFTCVVVCATGFLGTCHCCLSIHGMTTHEYLRSSNKSREYDRGCIRNWKAYWVRPTSRILCKGNYNPEDYFEKESNIFIIKPV